MRAKERRGEKRGGEGREVEEMRKEEKKRQKKMGLEIYFFFKSLLHVGTIAEI
jgi:hypothetical protein